MPRGLNILLSLNPDTQSRVYEPIDITQTLFFFWSLPFSPVTNWAHLFKYQTLFQSSLRFSISSMDLIATLGELRLGGFQCGEKNLSLPKTVNGGRRRNVNGANAISSPKHMKLFPS